MDVVVIGAGIVGCAIAYELASRGARVRVLDMRGVGQGATQASAGVLCPYIEGHSSALLRLGVRSLQMYEEFVARAVRDGNRPVEYRRSGTLEVALGREDARRLKSAADTLARERVDHHYLGPQAARDLEPALTASVVAALLVPAHAYVGVAAFTEALAAAATARGASIESGITVTRVSSQPGLISIDTDRGSFDTEAVVVAAGSWSARVETGSAIAPVRPVRGQLLHLSHQQPPISRVMWGADCYVVPWQDGTVLVGATVEDVGFDERATVAGVRGLLERGCELLPALAQAVFLGVRVGLRPASSDDLPIIGRSSVHPGILYATGHYRNGVLLAPLTAVAVADLLLTSKEPPELALTRPSRFAL